MNEPTAEQLAALRVRIAELCGWKQLPNTLWKKRNKLCRGTQNYTGSLDAMHEAEKVLPQGKLGPYSDELRLLLLPATSELSLTLQYRQWHAEAWQRAVALDRTLSPEPIL